MRNTFRQFGTFAKIEDQPDGTIMVYGVASSGAVDQAGEIIMPEAMKAALPDYSKFPALREMHEASAAGRVTEADVDTDGFTNIVAHVVDPVAVTKVKTKTYAGFSIGGKVLKRDPTDKSVITALKLVEISLVDSPCNPDAVLSMWKADMSTYSPSGDEVVAEAKAMAEAAGSKRYKDFLFKAREALIQKALEADLGDEGDTDEGAGAEAAAAAETDADEAEQVSVEIETEKVATAETATEAAAGDDAGAVTEADEPVEKVDPVAALEDALKKAADAVTVETEVEASGPFTDFTKAADALLAIRGDDAIAKGLYGVSRLAELMQSFSYLRECIVDEEAREGDAASTQPGKATEILAQMGGLLVIMAQEEVAEALASIDGDAVVIEVVSPDEDIVFLANEIIDLVKADADLMEKAGARNSKTDMAKIQASHDHMIALGATCDKANCPDDEGDAEKAALVADNERLTKALTDAAPQVEEITKRFDDEVTTLKGTIADLTKRLEQVESEPAARKTATSLRAITKVQDVSSNNEAAADEFSNLTPEQFNKHLEALPEKDRGEILLRIALKNPLFAQAARAAA